jgi:hypothetical protein
VQSHPDGHAIAQPVAIPEPYAECLADRVSKCVGHAFANPDHLADTDGFADVDPQSVTDVEPVADVEPIAVPLTDGVSDGNAVRVGVTVPEPEHHWLPATGGPR